jgi:transposase-like protein
MSADANLTAPEFTDEEAAIAHLEASRWGGEVSCPHCGSLNVHRMEGKTQAGMFLCNDCRDKFTARTGTVMERSHIPVHKWLLAIHLLNSSKKGFSAHQLHRSLGVTYKSAWFLAHRIREAMKETTKTSGPLGGKGKVIEADELYYGKRETPRPSPQRRGAPYIKKGKAAQKRVILGLVERGGNVRTFHIQTASTADISAIVRVNVSRESALQTDEHPSYIELGKEFKGGHQTVNHGAEEYVRREAERLVTTNTIENVFSVFKRGMKGVYQHCGEAHLHRYLAEFDFRYNRRSALGVSDKERAAKALKGIAGKRLTYRRPDKAIDAQAES